MTKSPLDAVAPELRQALSSFPPLDFSQGLEAYRQPLRGLVVPPPEGPLASVDREERFVPGGADSPDVRVLLYSPPGDTTEPRPAVLHIHGGGFVLGTPELNDVANRAMALELGALVVSVEYRLAPEVAWPGALHDCYAALCWLHDNAAQIGVDPSRIAVAGESAGGGHAVALALHARDQGGPDIRLQVLDAPMLDDRTGVTGEPHPHCGQFVWKAETNRFGWSALLGQDAGGPDVPAAAVPARATDLAGLAPTFITVGALDLLLDESLEWTRRLALAGVPVELHVIPGAYHGFSLASGTPQVQQIEQLRTQALARAFRMASANRG
ncbi:triacylglycerol lipase [Novosphingobium chloroacetimidivorans]|uniref:Triacylglycerol lipase n=1 Tax=Novosphingobium chloroacetimidivorans TaxID=1428314 RepID=A0A7W7KAU1_9SPHN|nr:alpha/beta hydrolase [Novosphingobium chloroacetimidivorans]MBB4858864.1 triacylglycerol lipase [Novosphingobium chloroacetimidivorans]